MEIRNLEPLPLWNYFADLNAVPRPSKKEEKVIQFIKSFGEKLKLPTYVDEVGNVIIKKPASPGMENRQTVVLQSHLDMVHQKNEGTDFDFATQGIRMYVDDDWVKAEGTTLGADNGIGVASIMTILASKDIVHPPIEALFTIDEETGMTGALKLKGGLLKGKIMLNLDTEDDQELTIGCAGGVDVTATGVYKEKATPSYSASLRISLKGLTGGHSGMEIHLGRGNANKLMNRLLHFATEEFGIQIHSINGGGLRNAIPRESFAEIAIQKDSIATFETFMADQQAILKDEYHTTDPGLALEVTPIPAQPYVLGENFHRLILRSLYACPNGIYRMSPDIPGLVQSSNNLARVLVQGGSYTFMCLTRSAVNSEKMDLAEAIRCAFELSGASVKFEGAYPGWTPDPHSTILTTMRSLYKELYHSDPHVYACHAGLECGILGQNYPQMEMISFGPNIRGAHSPDEKVQISSVQKYWGFLLETLKRTPLS
ncbi:MAG: aminoacyl-histidine dipeptidase [Bacteroidia bacterium]|nr:aminoacyl-histidine dipeptidase [Bacteroidia bacterium]